MRIPGEDAQHNRSLLRRDDRSWNILAMLSSRTRAFCAEGPVATLAMLSIRAVVLMRVPGEDAQQVPPSSGRQAHGTSSRCCPFAPLCSCEFPARMLNTTGPSFVGTTGHGTSSRCCRPERALFARRDLLLSLAMLSIRAVVLMRIPGEDAQQVPPSSGRQGGAIFRRTRASAGSRRGRRSRTATTSGFRNALRSRLLRR
jgi:hypothetical protein